jgi:hypothetical protein
VGFASAHAEKFGPPQRSGQGINVIWHASDARSLQIVTASLIDRCRCLSSVVR